MIGYIYQLICPIKNKTIYVGSTKDSLRTRLYNHMGQLPYSNSPIHKYLKEIGVKPIISLLAEIEYENVHELRLAERSWILKLTESGTILFNTQIPRIEKCDTSNLITIRFTEENKYMIQELKDIAEERGVSLNFLCLEILRDHICNQNIKVA